MGSGLSPSSSSTVMGNDAEGSPLGPGSLSQGWPHSQGMQVSCSCSGIPGSVPPFEEGAVPSSPGGLCVLRRHWL